MAVADERAGRSAGRTGQPGARGIEPAARRRAGDEPARRRAPRVPGTVAAAPSRAPDPKTGPGGARDRKAVLRFVERFAVLLGQTGFARMPARVFSALLATDSGQLTAAELSDMLQVSPAAISGAVRYLIQLGLASRERETGSRRDHYRVPDDVWYEVVRVREQMTAGWVPTLQEGIEAVGAGSPAAERLAETAAFFEFLRKEGPELLARWHEHRSSISG